MYFSLLFLHIAGGALALSGAVGALASPKGGRWHLYFGRAFAVGMLMVVVTALPMAIIRPNLFLFLVGIFSGYLVLTGWLRVRNRSGVPRLVDWVAAGAMAVAAMVMCIWGIVLLRSGHSMGVVLLVFGSIGGAFAVTDLFFLKAKRYVGVVRVSSHLTRMLGGTIAAVTAFAVTNVRFEPGFALWLAPTLALTPVIVYWNFRIRRYAERA